MKPAIVALSLLLGACASYIEQGKDIADQAAKVQLQVPCTIDLGAYFRLPQAKHDAVKAYGKAICP